MAVKCYRLAKKRQWKRSKKEVDRLNYRHACRKAYILINNSRNKDQFHKIEDCASDPKRKWTAIKDILNPTTSQPTSMPHEDKSRATSCAFFFRDKVINIRAAISWCPFRCDAWWQTVQQTRALQPATCHRRWGSEGAFPTSFKRWRHFLSRLDWMQVIHWIICQYPTLTRSVRYWNACYLLI